MRTKPARRLILAMFLTLAAGTPARSAAPASNPTPSSPAALAGQQPVRLILDCDMDSDCDDAGALGILNVLADRGEVRILAVMLSALDPYAGPCADAINTYYGRPNIPIGSARAPAPMYKSRYTEGVAKRCPHDLQRSDAAEDAVVLYRRILSTQADQSVTLVTIGDMTNLAKLVREPAKDGQTSGSDLIARKVKLWICMGGNFIGHPAHDDLKRGNNNFTVDAKATYAAITNWPAPIVFAGREVCSVPSGLKAGAHLAGTPADNPVRIAYELYFGGKARDRHVADLVTVLYAVRGLGERWSAEGPGRMDLQPDMTFTWIPDPSGRQAYLLKRTIDGKPNDRAVEHEVDTLLTTAPVTPSSPARSPAAHLPG